MVLKRSNKGGVVAALVQMLKEQGYFTEEFSEDAVSATFGPQVEKAVRRLQSHVGIEVDGQCGPETFRYLCQMIPIDVRGLEDVYYESIRVLCDGRISISDQAVVEHRTKFLSKHIQGIEVFIRTLNTTPQVWVNSQTIKALRELGYTWHVDSKQWAKAAPPIEGDAIDSQA